MTDPTPVPDAPAPGDRLQPPARIVAWVLTGVLVGFTALVAAAVLTPAVGTSRLVAGLLGIPSLLAATLGFRPHDDSRHADGPLPERQGARLVHALVTIGTVVVLMKVIGD